MGEEEDNMKLRVMKLLGWIAEEQRACRRCGAQIWMVRHQNGKVAPYTDEARNHFIDCPNAAEFRSHRS